jgi:2-(1,2-epoxy-1,2-dihydrophenyl)acetyl-CoA isomerase
MEELLARQEAGVLHLTFNAPERRNPLSLALRDALRDRLRAAGEDAAVRCVVLSGAGGHFMAGGDVAVFGRTLAMADDERRAFFEDRIHGLGPVLDQIRDTPKPVVAKLRGACAGVGVAIMLACDLAFAAEDAFLATAYVHLGATPDGGLSWLLPRAVGTRAAAEMLMLGDRVPAREALRLGMLNGVVAGETLDAHVEQVARQLAEGPARSLGAIKRLLRHAAEASFEAQMAEERRSFATLSATSDFAEGVTAFLEKRRPRFTGR